MLKCADPMPTSLGTAEPDMGPDVLNGRVRQVDG